jgi:hypothetical protein
MEERRHGEVTIFQDFFLERRWTPADGAIDMIRCVKKGFVVQAIAFFDTTGNAGL